MNCSRTALILWSLLLFTISVNAENLPLDQVQFKATHNSYQLSDPPRIQIDKYDVWEVELDFGLGFDSDEFLVGHDYPNARHGMISLGDWVRNCLEAEALVNRPLILKLEAKTHKPCGQLRLASFRCVSGWDRDWQVRLADLLEIWLGDRWLTSGQFSNQFDSTWLPVDELAGKVIVTLQDSRDNTDISFDRNLFFRGDLPGLTAAWPPVKLKEEFQSAIASGYNRIIMDDAYRQPWTKISLDSNSNRSSGKVRE